MAYKQNNNPLKKLNQGLQSFGERHSAWKEKRRQASIGDDGLTSMERRRAEKKTRRPGESKFKADIRRRKESRKQPISKKNQFTDLPDPKSKINIEGANKPSWDYKGHQVIGNELVEKRNPGDLREQSTYYSTVLPSAPGDPFKYEVNESGEILYWDTRVETEDGYPDWKYPEPGSADDRAIRKRYTGSETGDLSSWHGHNTTGDASSRSLNPDTHEMYVDWNKDDFRWTDIERRSYLPYDLAQKKYNPSYKGLKNKK